MPDDLHRARHARDHARDPGAPPLQRFLDDVVVDAAGDRRARGHWLHRGAAEDARFVGVLRDLAEQRIPVVVHTPTGVRHGVIGALGRDFAVVDDRRQALRLVSLAAITQVRVPAHGRSEPVGARDDVYDVGLLEVLARFAGERPEVVVWCGAGAGPVPGSAGSAGDHVVRGRLVGVGHDVLTVRAGGDEPADVVVPGTAVAEIVVSH